MRCAPTARSARSATRCATSSERTTRSARANCQEPGQVSDLTPVEAVRGTRLRRRGELLDHLGDVPVRVVDAELVLGAVAAHEDLRDPLELALAAELPRVRLDVTQRPADQLADRDAVPAPGDEVHHGRGEPVARGEPLVLG